MKPCALVGCTRLAEIGELVILSGYLQDWHPERAIAVCPPCSARLREFDGETFPGVWPRDLRELDGV